MEPNRLRGEKPFPELGEGVVLRFTNSDCMALQQKFGANWFTGAVARADAFDLDFLFYAIEKGAKKDGKPFKVSPTAMDEMPMVIIPPIVLDALFLAVHGKTFAEFVGWITTEAGSAEEDPRPSQEN
jgi:hypothetical protein